MNRRTRCAGIARVLVVAAVAAVGRPVAAQCETWYPVVAGGQTGMGGTSPDVQSLYVWNGDLVAGGRFTSVGGQTVNNIARFDGTAWHAFVSGGQTGLGGVSFGPQAMTTFDENLIVGGDFTTAGGQTVNRIARWDGSAWHPFIAGGETGVGGASAKVNALVVWNGELYAGGTFATAGGQTVNNIARWDGTSWHPLISGGQTGVSGTVTALVIWNGDLVATGLFDTAGGQTVNKLVRWDGSAFHPMTQGGQTGVYLTDGSGNPIPGGAPSALTVYEDDLVIGGQFDSAGGMDMHGITRWDGTSFSPFIAWGQAGFDNTTLRCLFVHNGDLIAGGVFQKAGAESVSNIARWDGVEWHPLGLGTSNTVSDLAAWNGSLFASGFFVSAGDQTVNRLARWGTTGEPCDPLEPVYSFSLDTDPGWTISGGAWAFGDPAGLSGDPNSGYTGTNVYGFNLSGDYTNNMPAHSLTTTPIDCSELTGVHLRFRRWLGVERAEWDSARLQVSTDGTAFTTIWQNPIFSSMNDSAWKLCEYFVPQAANQSAVYFRWVMGATNSSGVAHGWNIDDVEIWGVVPQVPCPLDVAPPGGDGVVGIADLLLVIGAWGANPGHPADINGDGNVGIADLLAIIGGWGACT